MNYWILKGHKERFDAPRFEDNFADGITDSWPTRKPLPEFLKRKVMLLYGSCSLASGLCALLKLET